MALEPKVHDLLLITLFQRIVTSKTPAMDNNSPPVVSVTGASTELDRFVSNHKNDGMQNVYYSFRKKKARQAAKEHRERHKEYVIALEKRNAVLEHQNEALKAQIKKLKQFYEQDLLNSN